MTRDVEEREDTRHEAEPSQQVEERAMGHRRCHSRLRVDIMNCSGSLWCGK